MKKRQTRAKMPKIPKLSIKGDQLNTTTSPPIPDPNSNPTQPTPSYPGMPGTNGQTQVSHGGSPVVGTGLWSTITAHLAVLNQSKYFAGLCMIMLNVGSKYVTIKFSQSAEEYFKANVTKQILVFSMAWMVTRDIITALIITAVFVILSDHLLNEESRFCVVPKKYHVLNTLIDTNGDGIISDEEMQKAEETLRKAKQQKIRQEQRSAFMKFNHEENE